MGVNTHNEGTSERAAFQRASEQLVSLMNTDAPAAVAEARKLPTPNNNRHLLRAPVLCDAGVAAADLLAYEESSMIFTRLNEIRPGDCSLIYDFAFALVAQANLNCPSDPDWHLRTARLRRRARALFGDAARRLSVDNPRLASQVLTNLGNSLDAA